jgi:hypothetical protein
MQTLDLEDALEVTYRERGKAEGITQLLTFQHLAGIVRTTCNNAP